MRHHPLREQGVERLDRFGGQVAGGVHGAGEESGIQQVQYRVFDAADILIDVHPIRGVLGNGGRGRMGRGKTGVIPRRVNEGIHRVGFPPRIRPAFRASAIAPRRMPVQRIAGLIEAHVIGQPNRQVFLLLGHHTAGVAMNDRNRATPIALPRNAPVAQAVIGDATPDAARVVRDRNRITGGGVTAGIDFGLTLIAKLRSPVYAKAVQLYLEYDPQPPFDSGTPEKAGAARVEKLRALQMERILRAEAQIERAALVP